MNDNINPTSKVFGFVQGQGNNPQVGRVGDKGQLLGKGQRATIKSHELIQPKPKTKRK